MTRHEIAMFQIRALQVFLLAIGITSPAVAQSKIYWTDIEEDRVYRANLDGTNRQTLFQDAPGHNADLYDLDIDPLGTLYWAGDNDGMLDNYRAVRRANLDGTNPNVIQIGPLSSTIFPEDVELDRSSGFLYVATQDGVIRIKTDGSNLEGPFLSRGSSGLALDVPAGKVYWTEYDLDRILRSNLDGTNIETIFDYPAFTENNPIDIEVDREHGWLFWTNPLAHQIVRSDLDGENVTVIRTVDGFPQRLDIDRANNLIYYTNNTGHRIERIDFDGQNHSIVISGLTNPIGVKIGPEFPVPEPATVWLVATWMLSAGVMMRRVSGVRTGAWDRLKADG